MMQLLRNIHPPERTTRMNNMKSRITLCATTILTLVVGASLGASKSAPTAKGSPYPLATCPVSGKPLTKDAVIFVMEDKANALNDGREIRLCCGNCVEPFKTDPSKFLPAIDTAIIAQQRARYPLTNCVVMTEDELPAAGSPDADKVKEIVVLNDMVRLCCPGCLKKIRKDPTKYLADINAAVIATQKQNYALVTCPISGEALPAEPTDIVIGERLVRLCCGGCADKARKDPTAMFAKLDAGTTKTAPTAPTKPAAPATTTK